MFCVAVLAIIENGISNLSTLLFSTLDFVKFCFLYFKALSIYSREIKTQKFVYKAVHGSFIHSSGGGERNQMFSKHVVHLRNRILFSNFLKSKTKKPCWSATWIDMKISILSE